LLSSLISEQTEIKQHIKWIVRYKKKIEKHRITRVCTEINWIFCATHLR